MQVSKSQESSSEKQSELDDAMHLTAETQKYLKGVSAACEQKAREFKQRTKLRSDETSAIQEAIRLLTSPVVERVSQQQNLPASFLQTRRTAHKVFRRLLGANSPALSFLAVRMQTQLASQQGVSADPMAKVKKTIEGVIEKLLTEAAEEAEHKEWCEKEMKKSEEQKQQHETDIKELQSQISEMEAQAQQLKDEMEQLTKDITEMEWFAQEAKAMRGEEHDEALIQIKEYSDAQSLIQNAVTVLQEFYSKQNQEGKPAELVFMQVSDTPQPSPIMDGRPPAPDVFEGDYNADDTAAKGVISLLETALADFQKMQSEAEMSERTAARDYDNLVNEAKVKRATVEKDVEYKYNVEVKLQNALQQAKTELKGSEEELETVVAYIEKLVPSCDMSESYEERKARREVEIKALQQSLAVLNGEEIAPAQ